MPKKYITVSDEMDRLIMQESERRGAPYAAIVREAIELWAKSKGIEIEDTVTWGGARKPEAEPRESESTDQVAALATGAA